jgi:hypothetical protein
MFTGWILVFFLIASISSSAGGCKGGIDRFSLPLFTSTDGDHWKATYSCYGGGTKTIDSQGQVP